jgi:D-sedoheptulose 7-phosphate isomerase
MGEHRPGTVHRTSTKWQCHANMTPAGKITFSEKFLAETISVLKEIEADEIEAVARGLSMVRDQAGRLFVVGVGDASAYARHAAFDLIKTCNFEAYAPSDSINSSWTNWLIDRHLLSRDGILIFSVGGGVPESDISTDLAGTIDFCRTVRASVFGILGRDGGHTAQAADACVVIPPVFAERIGAHTEGLFAVVWNLLVSHPVLQRQSTQPLAQLAPRRLAPHFPEPGAQANPIVTFERDQLAGDKTG